MKVLEGKDFYMVDGIAECDSCKGTGLYQGFAEKDGAFVICYDCDGRGSVKIHLKFNKFTKRKRQSKCNRVYTQGMGYALMDKDVTATNGRFFPFSKYGCSYEEWLQGKKPLPLKFLGCPYQETQQGLQSEDVNDLYKTRCNKGLGCGRSISECDFYFDKDKCWEIYDPNPQEV